MTSKNLTYKLSKGVFQQIREMRTFALLLAILYFVTGPSNLFMSLSAYKNGALMDDTPASELLSSVIYLFRDQYFGQFYFISIFIGFLSGIYICRYQNKRKESDFYHSLPVSRHNLLTERLLAVILIQAVLMACIMVIAPLTVMFSSFLSSAGFEGFAGLIGGWALTSYVNIMLGFLLALALAVFAGQLVGSTTAQVLMLIVLNVTIPMVGVMLEYVQTSFYTTYQSGGIALFLQKINIVNAFEKIFLTSTWTNSLSQYGRGELLLNASNYVVIVALIVILLALSYWLYSRRPAEKAGDTLIYRWVGTVIKMIYVVLGAFTLGSVLGDSSFVGFVIGAVVAGIVVHMVAEMIYNQDVFGIKKHLVSSVVATVVALLLAACAFYNVVDYDHYLPKESNVTAVAVSSIPANDLYGYGEYYSMSYSEDLEYIEYVMNMAQEVSDSNLGASQNYSVNTLLYSSGYSASNYTSGDYVDVSIGYRTRSGIETVRYYTMTVEQAIEIFAELNNQSEYHDGLWRDIVDGTTNAYSVDALGMYASGYADYGYDSYISFYIWDDGTQAVTANADFERADALLTALQHDLSVRNKATILSRPIALVEVNSYRITIYENDAEVAALLNQWRENGILQTEENTIKSIMQVYDIALIHYTDDEDDEFGFTIERLLTDEDEVVDFLLNDVATISQVVAGAEYEEDYAIGIFGKYEGEDDMRYYINDCFYILKGKLPTE